MLNLHEFMLDPTQLIEAGGLLLIALIIFAESGLLVGFFLPGDTLLFSAGLLASQGEFSLGWLIVTTIAAAVIGDNVGYSIGRRTGRRMFSKKDSILFRHEYVEKAEEFYEKHGGKTIILARFTPIVRTFAPVVAGIGKMDRKKFMLYNIVGGILWGGGLTSAGYWLGSKIPHLDKYIELVIVTVVLLSLGLSLVHVFKEREARQRLVTKCRLLFQNIFLNKKVD